MSPLTKSQGNMYPWVTHTHSHLGGACPHECRYCYVKAMAKRYGLERYSGPARLIESELAIKYGAGKTIFIEHCQDLFSLAIGPAWIERIIDHCIEWPENTYVFQTKNPRRMVKWQDCLPLKKILGVTVETNRDMSGISQAPSPEERLISFCEIDSPKFITIEPILDFDPFAFIGMIRAARPDFVNIGADSKGHGLPEPSADKVRSLVAGLQEAGIEIRQKRNLDRLLKGA